jgi:hypothetical protein
MSVTLRVRFPDLTVTSVAGVMREYPYTICPESVDRLERLVGLAVGGGFTRALNERLGRQNGCSHLTALVHAMLPVITQAADSAFHDLLSTILPSLRMLVRVSGGLIPVTHGAATDRLRIGFARAIPLQ